MRVRGSKFRVRSVLTVIIMSMFLILPIVGFAATPPEPATRWPHCQQHNVTYAEAESVRCGDSLNGVGVLLAQSQDYGPFLCGVCQQCMDRGVCTLTDTMIVVGNVGNFILAIVGSLALLIFVIGGVLLLVSRGESAKVQKGRQFIIASAVGIAVTLGAVLILRTLLSVVESGSPGTGSSGGIVCDGTNNGASCGEAAKCYNGACTGLCEIQQTTALQSDPFAGYQCVNPASYPGANCIPNLCTGGTDNVCCDVAGIP